jgi:hypothetical protein
MVCLTLCFLLGHLSIVSGITPYRSAIHYISLGRDCQVANELKESNLRDGAYPLDWMVSPNFFGILQAFKEDFKYFLDPAFLVYQVVHVENTYYQFFYNHFFPVEQPVTGIPKILPNYLDYLPSAQATQGKHIQRLLDLLSSKDKIVFIRTHSTPHEAQAFMNMIKEKNPRLDVLLVIVHERKDLIGDWNIPNVLNFYASQRCQLANWWSREEWIHIFNKIQNWLSLQAILNGKPSS